MNSIASRLARVLRINCCLDQEISLALGVGRAPRRWYSAGPYDSENEMNDDDNNVGGEEAVAVEKGESDAGADGYDEILGEKREMQLQGVDPRRGWVFRGVHKGIICGRIGQAPVQKMLRNGRTVTIFTVGTGGLFDQRIVGAKDLPKPAQWHRIAVHNEALGAYAIQQLVKNSSVYVEGDIETRVYNDSINGEVKNIPEICVRFDGRIRLIKSGESVAKLNFDDLRELRNISMISLHFNRVRGYFRHKLSRSVNWLGTVLQPNMPWLSSREHCLNAYLSGNFLGAGNPNFIT